jgi:DNA (cytosine-5)-methyltransferase 1
MRIFSTFTGIGGFEIGIEAAFHNRYEAEGQPSILQEYEPHATSESLERTATCVGYSEIDKYAISVYERHYPNVTNYGDITKINPEELPDFDCLVGGFPCQAFSIAGKRGGFNDTRGTLFFDLARILQAKQPRLFVFENVKGLLSHDDGKTFRTIITTIDELGYDAQWQVINSKNHGVPQNRERVIIVGHRRGTRRPEVFPIHGTTGSDTPFRALRAHTGGASERDTFIKQPKVVIAAQRGRYNADGKIEQKLEPRFDGLSNTLTAVEKDNMVYKPMIRRLTPKECERLQAFPDNHTEYGIEWITDNHGLLQKRLKPISDTQRYKMCGNAVTTNVIRDVFERILA